MNERQLKRIISSNKSEQDFLTKSLDRRRKKSKQSLLPITEVQVEDQAAREVESPPPETSPALNVVNE